MPHHDESPDHCATVDDVLHTDDAATHDDIDVEAGGHDIDHPGQRHDHVDAVIDDIDDRAGGVLGGRVRLGR